MKKTLIAIAFSVLCLQLGAQDSSDNYQKLYNSLVRRVGYAGIGVETVLDKWQKADSLNADAMIGRFNYLYVKSSRDSVAVHPGPKFLGNPPVMTLKDSLGNDVKYFNEFFFDETVFGQALKTLDKAISVYPLRMDLCAMRVDALLAYEKESPDMAFQYLVELIDKYFANPSQWEYQGVALDKEAFCSLVQEYCYGFYRCSSASGYEAFRSVSQQMTKYVPSNPSFINNLGSYYTIARQNDKAALKYYNKVLKIDPANDIARQNIALIKRREAQSKAAKK